MTKYFAVLDVIISSDFHKLTIVDDINSDFVKGIKSHNIPYLSVSKKTTDHHREIIYRNVIIPYDVSETEYSVNSLGLNSINLENQPKMCYRSDNVLSALALARTHCVNSMNKIFKKYNQFQNGYKINIKRIIPAELLKLYYSDGSITKNDGSNHASYAVAELMYDLTNNCNNLSESMTGLKYSYNIYTEVIPNGTNNIGELSGLHRAIKESIKNTDTDDIIVITCDSEYSIRSMREYILNWVKNDFKSNGRDIKNIELIKSMWNDLQELVDNRIAAIRWIKGHSNDPFNELCDSEAKKVLGLK